MSIEIDTEILVTIRYNKEYCSDKCPGHIIDYCQLFDVSLDYIIPPSKDKRCDQCLKITKLKK